MELIEIKRKLIKQIENSTNKSKSDYLALSALIDKWNVDSINAAVKSWHKENNRGTDYKRKKPIKRAAPVGTKLTETKSIVITKKSVIKVDSKSKPTFISLSKDNQISALALKEEISKDDFHLVNGNKRGQTDSKEVTKVWVE